MWFNIVKGGRTRRINLVAYDAAIEEAINNAESSIPLFTIHGLHAAMAQYYYPKAGKQPGSANNEPLPRGWSIYASNKLKALGYVSSMYKRQQPRRGKFGILIYRGRKYWHPEDFNLPASEIERIARIKSGRILARGQKHIREIDEVADEFE